MADGIPTVVVELWVDNHINSPDNTVGSIDNSVNLIDNNVNSIDDSVNPANNSINPTGDSTDLIDVTAKSTSSSVNHANSTFIENEVPELYAGKDTAVKTMMPLEENVKNEEPIHVSNDCPVTDTVSLARKRLFDLPGILQDDCFLNTGSANEAGDFWFKGHTPLPSESEDEEDVAKEQCHKLLSFEHEFALPEACQSLQKTVGHARGKLVRNDFSFDEKDFRRHRKAAAQSGQPHIKQHRKHHKHKHSHSKENLCDNDLKEDIKRRAVPINNTPLKLLPQIRESKETSDHETKDVLDNVKTIHETIEVKELQSAEISVEVNENVADSSQEIPKQGHTGSYLEVSPAVTQKKKHHHHKRHNHARHLKNRGLNSQDTLESRIRSGMQTLEEERKAIRGIVSEIEEECDIKELEDITRHRMDNFQSIRRHAPHRRHVRSGMTTHMSDVESIRSFKPHIHIDMEDDQLKYAPKEYHPNAYQGDNSGFVELEELTQTEGNELQWKERARWIKFEEDVEKNERWGKPHVASLSFQSLLELRRGIETGSVLLNLDNYDLPTIFESVVENMIITDQVSNLLRDRIINVLSSKHWHQHQNKDDLRQRRFSMTSLTSQVKCDDKDSGLDAANVFSSETNLPESVANHSTERNNLITEPSKDFEIDLYCENDSEFSSNRAVKFRPIIQEPKGGRENPKYVSDVKQRIPEGAEATSVLVATLPELGRTAMAFVRLSQGCFLGNLTEVSIPIRFLFIIMGPPSSHDYYEIGRSIATLMSDKIFHDLAYTAKNRVDLLAAINSFLDDSIVLAPGDWDRHLLLPLLKAEITEKRRERIKLLKEKAQFQQPADDEPFCRTGRPFGGLKRDIVNHSQFYKSDFTDGLNWRCLVTIIFIFFTTLAPTITFGALLSKKTRGSLGVIETLLATSLCGILFSLTAGQPLIIVGTTGPILVFEQAIYELCHYFEIDFLIWRFWIGIWVMLILWLVVAAEGCYLVEYFTRFTEEVFSVLISLLFIYEAVNFLIVTLNKHPIDEKVMSTIKPVYSNSTLSVNNSMHMKEVYHKPQQTCHNEPNITLLSSLLVLGTYFIAAYLRKLRNSHFLSSKARRVLSDFGIPIAMTAMVLTNMFSHNVKNIPKIKMPHKFRPTSLERDSFIVNPIGDITFGWICVGVLPAVCVSILLFMETELTGVLLNKRKNKLKKGGGYNLDLFVMAAMTGLCSVLGLPWMCAATIRSVQHQNALAIMSRSHAPGERPYLLHIKEQRLTNLCIHLLIGFFMLAFDLIETIPLAVCFGVFLYLGMTSLTGIQFIEQIKLIFVPMKYHPNRKYVTCVKFRSLVTYTLIQVACLVVLIGTKLSPAAPAFPFVIIGMVFLRRLIERYYLEEELEELDNEDDDEDYDDGDEYGIAFAV